MKNFILLFALIIGLFFVACNSGSPNASKTDGPAEMLNPKKDTSSNAPANATIPDAKMGESQRRTDKNPLDTANRAQVMEQRRKMMQSLSDDQIERQARKVGESYCRCNTKQGDEKTKCQEAANRSLQNLDKLFSEKQIILFTKTFELTKERCK
ncbi:MAG: hypothetical protein IPI59_12575 [Sphingobacteriales bacterium]|nr:hypothetical protein [Sphingobacteriales bacterium]MBP9140871.1 hypothetical protein [Chitinophagales bacterium]MDA0197595.1 hypothetical protein [Bacteroidota bacterium]MBK7528362.1 hypothetical protein [Sphingobacteriales bacterium]MBK8680177.1 hypothetical protein [Sphingobacteriales bacterium]